MWRLYESRDKAAIERLQQQMAERCGIPTEIPALDDEPVLIGLVYERDKEITNFAFLEAQAEICLGGETALPFEEWDIAEAMLYKQVLKYRIRFVRAFVPTGMVEREKESKATPIERILSHFGFYREKPEVISVFSAHFH